MIEADGFETGPPIVEADAHRMRHRHDAIHLGEALVHALELPAHERVGRDEIARRCLAAHLHDAIDQLRDGQRPPVVSVQEVEELFSVVVGNVQMRQLFDLQRFRFEESRHQKKSGTPSGEKALHAL